MWTTWKASYSSATNSCKISIWDSSEAESEGMCSLRVCCSSARLIVGACWWTGLSQCLLITFLVFCERRFWPCESNCRIYLLGMAAESTGCPPLEIEILRWDSASETIVSQMPNKERFATEFLPLVGLPDSMVMSFRAVQRANLNQPGANLGPCLFITGDDGPQQDRMYAIFVSIHWCILSFFEIWVS